MARESQEYDQHWENGNTQLTLHHVVDYYHRQMLEIPSGGELAGKLGIHSSKTIARQGIGYCHGNLPQVLSDHQRIEAIGMGLLNAKGAERRGRRLSIPLYDTSGCVTNLAYLSRYGDVAVQRVLLDGQLSIDHPRSIAVYRDHLIVTDSLIAAILLRQAGVENTVAIPDLWRMRTEAIKYLLEERVGWVLLYLDSPYAVQMQTQLRDVNIQTTLIAHLTEHAYGHLRSFTTRDEIRSWFNKQISPGENARSKNRFTHCRLDSSRDEFDFSGYRYVVTGVPEMFTTSLKVNIRMIRGSLDLPDNVDLLSARSRSAFCTYMAAQLGLRDEQIGQDVLDIIAFVEQRRDSASENSSISTVALSGDDRQRVIDFLSRPDLIAAIREDVHLLGLVGDDANALLVYLCALSRKCFHPISILIQSESASGKSFLVETIGRLVPPDELISIKTVSEQALNYLSEQQLNGKFLIMGEAVHSSRIEYQLREMLSSGEISRLVTRKRRIDGELESTIVRKPVHVSLALTSTASRVNPENASRFFILKANESPDQTRAIHQAQRRRYRLSDHKTAAAVIPEIISRHHHISQVLERVRVINPYVDHIRFPSIRMRSRRDFKRVLDLIAVVCFLRQFQKTRQHDGDLEYISCDLEDYRIAYDLLRPVLDHGEDALSETAKQVLSAIADHCENGAADESDPPYVTQREIREYTGLSVDTVKRSFARLVEQEYLCLIRQARRGMRKYYRLITGDSAGNQADGYLVSPERLARMIDDDQCGENHGEVGKSGAVHTDAFNSLMKKQLTQSGAVGQGK
jgi:DNA-binding MarR family transcriptional regulator